MTDTAGAPLISIVLPTRNRAGIVARAIDSVRRQTYERWELIVVDDASTDDTPALLADIARADLRVSVVRSATASGAAAARNRGIGAARGNLIAFIDDDAEWLPRKLEVQLAAFAAAPAARVAYSTFVHRDSSGHDALTGSDAAAGRHAVGALLRSAFIDTSVVLAHRDVIRQVGGFDENLPRLQDWDLVLRLAHVAEFCFTQDPLVISHHTAGSISTRPTALIDACTTLAAKYESRLPASEFAVWLSTLGHTLMIAGAPHEGRQFLKRAVRSGPRSPRTLLLAGLSLTGTGVYNAVARARTAAIQLLRRRRTAAVRHVAVPVAPSDAPSAVDATTAVVDVIIVNWNGLRWLPRCLDALARSTIPHRVIVVDNASTDDSVAWLRTAHPDVTVLAATVNDGYAAGANRGLRFSAARYALVMNPDVLLEPDHLRILRDRLDQDARIGIAQGKLYSVTPAEFDSGSGQRRVLDSAGHMIRRSRMVVDRGQGENDGPAYEREASVFSACGAAMFLRRSMLDDLAPDGEYFGESFFAYKEDIDLGWRARLLGWDVRFIPAAIAHHVRTLPFGGEAWRQMSVFVRRHSWKNHYLLMIRNDRIGDILRSLPWIALWEGARLGHALLRDPRVLKAYVDLARELRRALHSRRLNLARRRARPADIRVWFGLNPGAGTQ